MRISLALAALAVTATAPLVAQTDDGTTFRWSGTVAAQHFIRVHNMNGDIRVEPSTGNQVEVVAERRVRRGDPKTVQFAVRMREDGDVVVCALWGSEMRCTDDGARGSYNSQGGWMGRNNQIDVVIRVKVPASVRTYARSTNGSVNVEAVSAEVDAATTNGDVVVRTRGGPVNAATTNGSVSASLGDVRGTAPMRFASTNGSVTVLMPPGLSADVEMRTTNGSVLTDFPLTINGRVSPKQLRGTLGSGGRSLVIQSTNGDVSLRRNSI